MAYTITDIFVSSGAPTTTPAQTVSAGLRIGNVAGVVRRTFITIAFEASDQGRVENFPLNLNVKQLAAAGGNFVIMGLHSPDLATVSMTAASWDERTVSGGAWTKADGTDDTATLTTGTGTNPGMGAYTGARALFASPTTSVSNPDYPCQSSDLDDVINAAKKYALEKGFLKIVLILFHEDESQAFSFAFAMTEDTTAALRPEVGSHTLYQTPLDGWILECAPHLRLPTTSSVSIGVQLGTADFSSYSVTSIFMTDDASSDSTFKDLATLSDRTNADGELYWSSLSGASSNPTYLAANGRGYTVSFSADGIGYNCPIFFAPYIVSPGTAYQSGITGDDHKLTLANEANGSVITDTTDGIEGLAVQDATDALIAARCGLSINNPRYWMFGGDNMDFAQYNSFLGFPVATDGSGLVTTGTSTIATSAAQAREAVRAWFVNSSFPIEKIPALLCIGNHAPFHWHGFSANNGAYSDISQWMLTALIEFKLIPPTSVTTGYSQPTSFEGLGHYSFDCGDTRNVVLNTGVHSSVDTGWSIYTSWIGGGTFPAGWQNPSDLKLDSDVLSWAIGRISGSTTKFLDWFQHTIMGDRVSTAQGPITQKYDRSDNSTAASVTGYWANNIAPTQRMYYRNRVKNNLFHDHCEDFVVIDGILIRWHASPGNNTSDAEGPYNEGFVQNGGSQDILLHSNSNGNSNQMDNAGYYLQIHTASSLKSQYRFAGASTDAAGDEFLTLSALYLQGFRADDVVRELQLPLNSAGESRRAWGRRPSGRRPAANRPAGNR